MTDQTNPKNSRDSLRIIGKPSHRFEGVVDVMVQPLAPLHHLPASVKIKSEFKQFLNHVGEAWIWRHCDARQERTRHQPRIRFPAIAIAIPITIELFSDSVPCDKGSRPIIFLGKLGILSQQGGGSRQSQLFIKIAQNLICLGTVHKCDETHST